jgi:hypothetical protein
MTNISNFHTLSTSIVNLITPLIVFMNLKLVELSHGEVYGSNIYVPICVYPISVLVFLWCVIIIIITIMPPTFIGKVSFLFSNLIIYSFPPW